MNEWYCTRQKIVYIKRFLCPRPLGGSDVVLETIQGLGFEHFGLGLSLAVCKTFVVILDGSEQGTP